ncbi:hypothetical protein QHH11_16855 [Aphanizomenon sp. PH219]|uniref:Uncharacterized protein n=1 Tax=Dolichospermum heterosporum TAC447 TaxID=747523 RepID=A0ABY5LRL8_9CYAN|nr:hypothetical protein [Dolichospermum heterosporum]MDK2412659.1 hypothetical protein [Aphanizomenon sp. 202]MDK2460784.1 hypothetical protein [Aphanizomenon sp. PH219]UUO14603.1 hypothetical protein NG743_21630 [Dolichospermum heterosporum TAC447]
MNAQAQNLQTLYAKTRLLLALWDLGASQQEVKKGLLTKRIVAKGQKMADYKGILEDLQEQGAVTVSRTGYTLNSPIGLDVLGAGLRSDEFKFEGTIVGTWAANALLRWIGQINVVAAPVASGGGVIGSYEEFKSEILDLFDKLDKSYSHAGLVPIWQIRKEVENRLQRDQFNAWIMDMQAEQLLYLQSGEARGATEEQKQDSINSEIRGLLFFVSKPL